MMLRPVTSLQERKSRLPRAAALHKRRAELQSSVAERQRKGGDRESPPIPMVGFQRGKRVRVGRLCPFRGRTPIERIHDFSLR